MGQQEIEMNAVPDFFGSGLSRKGQSASPIPTSSPDSAHGSVWLLDPLRVGHLTACLRALGVSMIHARHDEHDVI
jgi:hypothetical protein